MSIHPPVTGAEAADRLAIRKLFDASLIERAATATRGEKQHRELP